ncbi:MAG: 3-isopropylmalate dehydratase large subunit [Alphaproteobacteria bacterium]|nr:3-isopropylmalate dehydratase large subunit [Alphaproteobacteria bacterium]
MTNAKTLYQKIWDNHIVDVQEDGTNLLYVDRHIVHEVTSPQAFEALELAGRKARSPKSTLAISDHNTPTKDLDKPIENEASRIQLEALTENAKKFGITHHDMGDIENGVCHVVAPEQGFVLPGVTLVCGDSHTATHGAFGAMAFGIGTSEVEHVLATQTILQKPMKNMRINVEGKLPNGVTAKDIILHIIGVIGTAGATGYAVEFAGGTIRNLSMEERMTICNMSIEAGGRVGLIEPDETTFEYIKGRPQTPKAGNWEIAVAEWKRLKSDTDAVFDKEIHINANDIAPQVTWGTSPEDVIPVTGTIPYPADAPNDEKAKAMERALNYIGLNAGDKIESTKIDRVFIGSCTNGRLQDLREAAKVVKGRKVADNVNAMVVPGSGIVKELAEGEDLDEIFTEAGFEWREAGCSMCLAMNPDKLEPGERCASTSNRNFEGRQGRDGRTHLMSPAMAAAAAITGVITDIRKLQSN